MTIDCWTNGCLLAGAFAIPLLRLARPLWRRVGASGTRVNRSLGHLERTITRWRGPLAIGWGLYWLVSRTEPALGLAALALAALARWQRQATELECAGFMWNGPGLWPGEFFDASHLAYGPAGCPPDRPRSRGRDGDVYDLRRGSKGPLRLAFLHVLKSSAWMTGIAMNYGQRRGEAALVERIDRGMRLWGLQVLRISRASLRTEGIERLVGLKGKRLFLFNHVSQTDFAYGFPALDHFIGTEDEIKLRFVVAKDHFVDNPIVHSMTGIGRLILSIGMVPIDRKRTKNAIEALEQAAARVAEQPSDLAIYPQGTRGRPQLDGDGRVIDVGYYSSGRIERAADPLGHVRKGTAFLALDVAIALRDRGVPVHLVIVGIHGAGRLMAKGSLRMTAGVSLLYRVDEVLTIEPGDVEGLSKRGADGELTDEIRRRADDLTARIERSLARASEIDERLAGLFERFFARPMPDSAGLRRLFDQALTLDPVRRAPLFERLAALPPEVTDRDLEPLFELLTASR